MGTMMVIEKARLRECEATIEKGAETFVKVGEALAEIRDKKLYRETHKTFQAYCKDRWSHTGRWAYQLIEASAAAKNVNNCSQKPKVLSQARALADVPAEQQEEVWERASADGKPTAAKVKAAVEELDEPWDDEEEVEDEVSAEDAMAEWNKQVDAFARSITALAASAPKGGWWDESQANIVKQQLKSAAGSARQAKCDKVCPKCDGDGCKWCKSTGFMPARSYELAGGK